MVLNVLIVDDSPFFQRVLSDIINDHDQLQVVGVANNGNEAIEQVANLKPDLVTMDYEMPMMDGVTAVRTIMSKNPLPILMLSSMTFSGAKITIDALEAGAADFMTKNFAEISGKGAAIKKRLYNTLLALGRSALLSKRQRPTTANISNRKAELPNNASAEASTASHIRNSLSKPAQKNTHQTPQSQATTTVSKTNQIFETSEKPKLIVIGASTGGPAAITEVLKRLPASFKYPIMIVQHMPQNFTLAFSNRLNNQCNITVKEAQDGDRLIAGQALVAPGGKQMILDKTDNRRVRIIDSTKEVNYKPCVDISFASISNAYSKDVLAIILTGMGSDGCDGARLLKQQRATVWTQTEDSCVVYGMPMAIDRANLSNASLTLDKIAYHLTSL